MGEKSLYVCGVQVAVYELAPYQSVSVRRSWVNCQQEGQSVLVDFVYTENTRELAHDPGLIVSAEVK
jgi:hypothetical protein